jgi:hypothetical protein
MHSNILPGKIELWCGLCRSPFLLCPHYCLWYINDRHCRDTIGISPDSLLPKNVSGAKFKLKKVDCALPLRPDSSFSDKIRQKLMALPIEERSINQTSTAFINHFALIASFELKRQMSATDPLVQLGIWSAALAEKLRKFQGQGKKKSELMALPVVTIAGHHWSVYYSYTTDNGERVSFKLVIESSITLNHESTMLMLVQMLQGPGLLGSTMSFVGIYSIMKAIQIIAKYGVEKYMPWFEQHILDPVSSIPLGEGSAGERR